MVNITTISTPELTDKRSEYLGEKEILIIEAIVVGIVLTIITITLILCRIRRNQQLSQQLLQLTQPTPLFYRRVDIIRILNTNL